MLAAPALVHVAPARPCPLLFFFFTEELSLMRFITSIAVGVLALAPALGAQGAQGAQGASSATMPESYREVQLRMLEHQRKVLLAMADSMPERLYRDKATPTQRDFAEQIHHAAGAAAFIAGRTMGAAPATLPDTASALNSRAGLRSFVNAAFDYAANVLKTQNAQGRAEPVTLFGTTIPRWQWWDEIFTHTVWTAGSVVANFRKHGMAPPQFTFF
jgi:hypothetical protein